MINHTKQYLGLGKTKFNSSICLFSEGQKVTDAQLLLTERFNRKKASGAWPEIPILKILSQLNDNLTIGENRDVLKPRVMEDALDQYMPFYHYLKTKNISQFSSHFNPNLNFVGHHDAHAYAALSMSPFEKAIIVVLDGAGNRAEDLNYKTQELDAHEECSVYLQNFGHIQIVEKKWINFLKSKNHLTHIFSNGIGTLYEKASEFIFNSSTSSGKVMGLAPFGVPSDIDNILQFQESLNWGKAFSGKSKKEWQESLDCSYYCDLASSVQLKFEQEYFLLLNSLKLKYPDYENIILTGGCALNCTNNTKVLKSKLFKNIYVLPFPGDESISLGIAFSLHLKNNPDLWKMTPYQNQSAYLGDNTSIPTDKMVEDKLRENNISYEYFKDVTSAAALDLASNKIIGWFQGRSEAGPRALGNRSILANPLRKNLKNHLNEHIKFRENFRPYGCSVLQENVHEYFDVDKNFENPFMSFAIKVRPAFKDALKEVIHVDDTSRMQSLKKEQNPLFYELIKKFGDKTNLFCLLNTSFNIMDEPIVETVEDALNFFQKIPVDSVYIGNFRIQK